MLYPMTMDPGPQLDGPELVVVVVRTIRIVQQGVPIFGRGEWRPGWSKVEYSHVGVVPGERGDTRAAAEGLRLFANIPKHAGGRRKTPRDVKIKKLAEAGLKWLDANHKAERYVSVEDAGRPEIGEANGRGTKGVNDHMNRAPKIFNSDVHERMHEMLRERSSAR